MAGRASLRGEIADAQIREELTEFSIWYHTIDLRPGLQTPGVFDLRSVVDRLPWADIKGKRCLDVGTFDGFWAFEMERRGASEVYAVDVDDPMSYDWPEILSPRRLGRVLEGYDHGDTGQRFEFVHSVLGSGVQRRICSIYDLDPDEIGTFDVVFCSSLLLHLRDPMAALAALRRVCTGHLMTNDPIDLQQTLISPRRPAAHFDGVDRLQWWTPNPAGHVRMLQSAGFEVLRRARPVVMPYRERPTARGPRDVIRRGAHRLLTGMPQVGVLQQPILSRPI